MDFIDLLQLVKQFGKLDNVEVYGYISSRLERPINLFNSCKTLPDSMFVKMDVLAVNLQKYSHHLKDMGITNKENNDIYLVNGSLALNVSNRGVFPDWYACRGTIRLGSKTDGNYLAMFPFKKQSNGDWMIGNNVLDTMDISSWGRQSRLYLSVNKSLECGFVTVPDDVSRLPRFTAKMIQNTITPTVVTNQPKSLNDNLQNALNGVKPVEVITNKNNIIIENRDDILPLPDKVIELKDKLDKLKSERQSFILKLKNEFSLSDEIDDNFKYMINNLRLYLKSKPNNSASTGRMILKKYLSKFGDISDKEYLGTTVKDFLINDFDDVSKFILDNSYTVYIDGDAWKLCVQAFGVSEYTYAGLLAIILGIDFDKFVDLAKFCIQKEISFIKLINTNPYLILLISSNFSYSEVEHIAYCLGLSSDKSIEEFKYISIIYDNLNNSDTGSTVYNYTNFINSKIGTSLTKAKFNLCMSTGTYLTDTLRSNIKFYAKGSLSPDVYSFPKTGWIQSGYNYILPLSKNELILGVDSAIKYGLAVKFDSDNKSWISSNVLISKELFILEKVYELSKLKKGYDHKYIDYCIDKYEEKVGFKLEKEQREAVHLIDNFVAVITGPAGSGKTTVSDCMVYVLSCLDETDIEYAAPTGKAAKRLQEVVKKPVQTFNSKFKIFGHSDSLLDTEDTASSNPDVVYFFDEVAMTPLNLMYAVSRSLADCSVYFLGDICQLPPIGKGLPFKNFLRFLPCVRLSVTKRSAENSGVTYNSRVINEYSDYNNWQPLKEFDDFKIIPCNDDIIKDITVLLCKFHLGKITNEEMNQLCRLTNKSQNDFIRIPNLHPDDIQVVSPIGKQTYTWGTYQLNNELQKIFNTTRGYDKSFKYQVSESSNGTRFTLGDRVIHTDSNMYSMQWYSSYKNGVFTKRYGFGITNGDVGKVVAFYPSQSCEFEDEIDSKPDGFEYPVNLRDDSKYVSTGNWFIVVEYYDFMSDSNYYIIYRAIENLYVNNNECKVFTGDDLAKLNLFYAGTTHKMQGSQAKLIIGLLGRVNFKGFITRNMLYTEVTRASDGVYLVGSVSNDRNSQLSIARGSIADDGVVTVTELMYT